LIEGEYHINIDTKLFNGVLNYGEILIRGEKKEEVFISTYLCHPSMANNELSGPVVVAHIAKWIVERRKNKYSYRIIFIPETIGSITYLSRNLKKMKKNIVAGFNVSCIGDDNNYSYMPSRAGDTLADRAAMQALKSIDKNYRRYSWIDRGSDERQF